MQTTIRHRQYFNCGHVHLISIKSSSSNLFKSLQSMCKATCKPFFGLTVSAAGEDGHDNPILKFLVLLALHQSPKKCYRLILQLYSSGSTKA